MKSTTKIRVVQVPIEDEIRRLERFCARMERRYELDSESMLAPAEKGEVRLTLEVETWMMNYESLLDLRGLCVNSNGSRTSDIK